MRNVCNQLLIGLFGLCLSLSVGAIAAAQQGETSCERSFDSTYELIQEAIFENHGCTNLNCHGAAALGGLDLRDGVSYDNLLEQPSATIADGTIVGLKRLVPGQKDQSLLWINLAAATLPDQWDAPLRAMPLALPSLSIDELEALRIWIEQGAPGTGTVPGTGELLDACLPPPEPIEIEPLAPPDPAVGRQLKMPKWVLPAGGEQEVCFVSYYDVSEGIPARYLSADGKRFRYNRLQTRQDPLSHHLNLIKYEGTEPFDHPGWGEFRCTGGFREGERCVATDRDFCGEGACASEIRSSVNCIAFGPSNAALESVTVARLEEASFERPFPPGVYGELPTKGLMLWNSHAFNLTVEDAKLEAWLNFDFAEPEDQVGLVQEIFDQHAIFVMNTPVFAAEEICAYHVLPADGRLVDLVAHTHKRGKRFTVYQGRYRCDGGPRSGAACTPDPAVALDAPDICGGAPCVTDVPPRLGDCNGNGRVDISDLTVCVNIALGTQPVDECRTGDANDDQRVTVDELVSAVKVSLAGPEIDESDPELLYTNFVYDDPVLVTFEPPRAYPSALASAAARTLTYCAVYDNGASDPSEVKERSTSPSPSQSFAPGGPCDEPAGCTQGSVGALCTGAGAEERDASCDSSPGAGDGFCDACPLKGGVTTEDEMFILIGSFFVSSQ